MDDFEIPPSVFIKHLCNMEKLVIRACDKTIAFIKQHTAEPQRVLYYAIAKEIQRTQSSRRVDLVTDEFFDSLGFIPTSLASSSFLINYRDGLREFKIAEIQPSNDYYMLALKYLAPYKGSSVGDNL